MINRCLEWEIGLSEEQREILLRLVRVEINVAEDYGAQDMVEKLKNIESLLD
jgi:hypothetical protein